LSFYLKAMKYPYHSPFQGKCRVFRIIHLSIFCNKELPESSNR
jgi:hypothetical protein